MHKAAPHANHTDTSYPKRPRSVGVLVDLELAGNTGEHVKCWQRIAEAVAPMSDLIDLTVYFLGDRVETIPLSDSVRYVTLPPRLGTRQVAFLSQGAGHTDLAQPGAPFFLAAIRRRCRGLRYTRPSTNGCLYLSQHWHPYSSGAAKYEFVCHVRHQKIWDA
jgi:hypothetical protein